MLSELNKLIKKRKCIGRGGDRGGTSGKGHKGQKARSGGGVLTQFEGGQTPLTRRLPKRGFNNYNFSKKFTIVSLDMIDQIAKKSGNLIINKTMFLEFGIIKTLSERIKLLCNGKINTALTIYVNACANSAKITVEAAGGSVCIVEN